LRVVGERFAQLRLGGRELREQSAHRVVQLRVAVTGASQPLEAPLRRLVQRLREQVVDPLPPIRGEIPHHPHSTSCRTALTGHTRPRFISKAPARSRRRHPPGGSSRTATRARASSPASPYAPRGPSPRRSPRA